MPDNTDEDIKDIKKAIFRIEQELLDMRKILHDHANKISPMLITWELWKRRKKPKA